MRTESKRVKSHRTRYKASSISDGGPAKVAEHDRHRRRVAVCAQIAMQTKQRACEGPGTRQDGAPSVQSRMAGASVQHHRSGPSLGSGEESEEGLGLLRETTSCPPVSSGQVRFLRRRAMVNTAPSSSEPRRCRSPSARSVASIAN